MKLKLPIRRALALAAAAAAALLTAACVLSPGKFDATLDLRRDGRFTFTYTGEIYMLALSRMAEMSEQAEEFDPATCWDDETLEDRPCTEEELAEQRAEWEAGREERIAKARREAEEMRVLLGGIDPSDPQAAEEVAARLRRQEGWKRVEHKGDGLFEVEFSLASQLGHDFVFPTFERFPMANAFVLVNMRQGRQVRIDAPGFSAQSEGAGPFQGMMNAMAASEAEADEQPNPAATMEGTFRIVTDGQILANNTDEGPERGAGGQVLEWTVNSRTQSAPTALIALGS